MLQGRRATFAAIAGVMRTEPCILTKLYQAKKRASAALWLRQHLEKALVELELGGGLCLSTPQLCRSPVRSR